MKVNTNLGLKQFRDEGCISYCLYDRKTRQAALIDPKFGLMEEYRNFLIDNGLKPVWVLDTHIHADHFSATHLFRQEYGAEIGMAESTKSERPTRRLKSGEKIQVGGIEIKVLATPGHTPDSVSYYVDGLVFTGDTLFIGGSGRTDFPGSDPAQQWESLHNVLGGLPGETLVFPGHDYNDLLFSTISVERTKNRHLILDTKEKFVAMKQSEFMPNPTDEIRKRIEANLQAAPVLAAGSEEGCATACGAPAAPKEAIASINVEKYSHKLQERSAGTTFVDVREPEEFSEGHMPGATNIPLSEVGLHLNELQGAKRVYISCLSGRRSMFATQTLAYLGFPDVVNVTGGFKAWQASGLPVEKGSK
jgi:glyoxylase-like metal-dependent hydrolase (beta-lactamase superfamily II)/rhodanese-related sulfurtransferase